MISKPIIKSNKIDDAIAKIKRAIINRQKHTLNINKNLHNRGEFFEYRDNCLKLRELDNAKLYLSKAQILLYKYNLDVHL